MKSKHGRVTHSEKTGEEFPSSFTFPCLFLFFLFSLVLNTITHAAGEKGKNHTKEFDLAR